MSSPGFMRLYADDVELRHLSVVALPLRDWGQWHLRVADGCGEARSQGKAQHQ
jgi:hypothetical protein